MITMLRSALAGPIAMAMDGKTFGAKKVPAHNTDAPTLIMGDASVRTTRRTVVTMTVIERMGPRSMATGLSVAPLAVDATSQRALHG